MKDVWCEILKGTPISAILVIGIFIVTLGSFFYYVMIQ